MVTQKFQWFVDLATSADTMQVVKVTAGGQNVIRRLLPFFTAYKYFKLGQVSVRFVPAATLPVDPTGLSYEAGENTVDPRDQFNPGLVRITNGEDVFNDAQQFTYDDVAEGIYYNTMLDPRWYKFQLQSGFKRSAVPLYYNIGMFKQSNYAGSNILAPVTENGVALGGDTPGQAVMLDNPRSEGVIGAPELTGNINRLYSLYQTGLEGRLGWMPTDSMNSDPVSSLAPTAQYNGSFTVVPEVELLTIVLPKAYKTKFYYRVYVEETVHFREPVIIQWSENGLGDNSGYAPIDRFVRPGATYNMPSAKSTISG
uniref:Capsid protein n=1 Tax=Chrysolophus pictus Smacoviridae sp. TaxID=2814972 RepID=A0A8A4XD57_9VIRU